MTNEKGRIAEMINQKKQEIMEYMKASRKEAVTKNEIYNAIDDGPDGRHLFDYAFEELLRSFDIVADDAGKYALAERRGVVKGVFSAHERGFGFVRREPPLHDFYIAPEDVGDALDQDIVIAAPSRRGGDRTGRFGHYSHGDGHSRGDGHSNETRHSHRHGHANETGLARRNEHAREYGVILAIAEYTIKTFVGEIGKQGEHYYAIPDNKKIAPAIGIRHRDLNGAREGQKALMEIVRRGAWSGDEGPRHFGKVVNVIGYTGNPGVDVASIIYSHGFTQEFPAAAQLEAEAVPDKVDGRRIRGRRDLRALRLFTIDGESAKDLDDAVSIELISDGGTGKTDGMNADADIGDAKYPIYKQSKAKKPVCKLGGAKYPIYKQSRAKEPVCELGDAKHPIYRLGVHIADVSAYVARDTALDREALRRGTSLYYADRVVPMLPQKLSNGICSLHPHVDRLALTVFMYIDGRGRILDHEICESVINSARRMTYENVYLILEERDAGLREAHADILGDLELMRGLASLLRETRIGRGALDFELRECQITLDAGGAPLSVEAERSTFANQLIEEFMIACNETVASAITAAGLPFIYRTHERPDEIKIEAFIGLANGLGVQSQDIREILRLSKGAAHEKLVSYILLRSLEKAGYTAQNIGHFGLASGCYCHFTSPIRRYPDLVAHRIVKNYIKKGGMARGERAMYEGSLGAVAAACSGRERAADEAERDVEALKKAEYMKKFLGDHFTGSISGVTSFGFFVELENTVEGLVRVADMDDYFVFDAERYILTGERTGSTYRIGDIVDVVLTRVNVESRQIDFMLLDSVRKMRGAAQPRPADQKRRKKANSEKRSNKTNMGRKGKKKRGNGASKRKM